MKDSIDILKTMRDPKTLRYNRRTPYEGVPKSFASAEMPHPNAWYFGISSVQGEISFKMDKRFFIEA